MSIGKVWPMMLTTPLLHPVLVPPGVFRYPKCFLCVCVSCVGFVSHHMGVYVPFAASFSLFHYTQQQVAEWYLSLTYFGGKKNEGCPTNASETQPTYLPSCFKMKKMSDYYFLE